MKNYLLIIISVFCTIFSVIAQNQRDTLVKNEKIVRATISKDGTKEVQEILYTTNGATYTFKSDKIIDFSERSNIIFPEGTTVLLIESRDNITIEAELRIRNDDYKLFFIKGGNLSDYYKNEDEWLTHFFKIIVHSQNNSGKQVVKEVVDSNSTITLKNENAESEGNLSIDTFLNTLKNIRMENNRYELLSSKIKSGLNIKDQKKIIGFIFGNFMNEENKVQLLSQLIDSPTWSKINNDYLLSFIDQFKFESNKVLLMKKLIK